MIKLMGDFGNYYSDAGIKIREFIAEPRLIDVAELVDALMGPEMSETFGLRNPPRNVALLPASIVDGDALIGVTRLGAEEWTAQEFDALSTLASVIAQTRGRVEAQNTSSVPDPSTNPESYTAYFATWRTAFGSSPCSRAMATSSPRKPSSAITPP